MEINVDVMLKKIYAYKNEKTNVAFDLPYRVYYPSDYSKDNGKTYFAVFSKDGQKIKLIFEPTEKMLDSFKIFVPRNVKE